MPRESGSHYCAATTPKQLNLRMNLPAKQFQFLTNSHEFPTARRSVRRHYQRSSTEPQVKPPPMASSSTMWPRLMRPSPTASHSANGMEAAEVLP